MCSFCVRFLLLGPCFFTRVNDLVLHIPAWWFCGHGFPSSHLRMKSRARRVARNVTYQPKLLACSENRERLPTYLMVDCSCQRYQCYQVVATLWSERSASIFVAFVAVLMRVVFPRPLLLWWSSFSFLVCSAHPCVLRVVCCVLVFALLLHAEAQNTLWHMGRAHVLSHSKYLCFGTAFKPKCGSGHS